MDNNRVCHAFCRKPSSSGRAAHALKTAFPDDGFKQRSLLATNIGARAVPDCDIEIFVQIIGAACLTRGVLQCQQNIWLLPYTL